MWRSLADGSNDCESAGYEKGQCLEDYQRRFEHAQNLYKNGAQDCWMRIRGSAACRWIRLHRVSLNWATLTSLSDEYDHETKYQTSQWKTPTLLRIKKARQSQKSKSCWSHSSTWGALSSLIESFAGRFSRCADRFVWLGHLARYSGQDYWTWITESCHLRWNWHSQALGGRPLRL